MPTTDDEFLHGEWHLWLYCCEWRLEVDEHVIAASNDERAKIEVEIQHLEGCVLKAFEVITPAFDSILTFEGKVVLRLFAVVTEGQDRESWLLYTPDKVLSIGPGEQWSYGE